jgi:hypothetical protein
MEKNLDLSYDHTDHQSGTSIAQDNLDSLSPKKKSNFKIGSEYRISVEPQKSHLA